MRKLVVTAAVALAAVGCGKGGSGSSPNATDRLRAAAKATIGARSFEIFVTRAGSAPVTIDYQAPDRVESRVVEPVPAGIEESIVIVVGPTSYETDHAHPGRFTSRAAQTSAADGVRGFEQPVAQAADVTEVAGTNHFTVQSAAAHVTGNASATLAGGYIHELVVPYVEEGSTGGIQTLTFSKFNSAPPVTAPAAAMVIPVDTGGATVGSSTAPVTGPSVTLPRVTTP